MDFFDTSRSDGWRSSPGFLPPQNSNDFQHQLRLLCPVSNYKALKLVWRFVVRFHQRYAEQGKVVRCKFLSHDYSISNCRQNRQSKMAHVTCTMKKRSIANNMIHVSWYTSFTSRVGKQLHIPYTSSHSPCIDTGLENRLTGRPPGVPLRPDSRDSRVNSGL